MDPTSESPRCPCCGRRQRARARLMRPAPLLDWIERQTTITPVPASAATGPRLMLRHDLRDAEGEPRACLALPGRPPLAFPSLSAALAALTSMEAGHGGR